MNINFEDVKVGDRLKTREVFKNGETFESEFTVTDVVAGLAYSAHRVLHKVYGGRESLTIKRVQMPEPEKIGTVVEYKRNGVTCTAVKYSDAQVVEYPWIRDDGYALPWDEILAYDANPKIKED